MPSRYELIEMERKNRHRIEEYLKKHPGASISQIAMDLRLDRGTVKRHLQKLCLMNRIHGEKNNGKWQFYWNGRNIWTREVDGINMRFVVDMQLDMRGRPFITVAQYWKNGTNQLFGSITLYKKEVENLISVLKYALQRMEEYADLDPTP